MLRISRLVRFPSFATKIANVEEMIRNRAPHIQVVETVSSIDPDQLCQTECIELAFLSARLHKLSPNNKTSKRLLSGIIERVAFGVDIQSQSPEYVSKLFWSCATLSVRPFVPSGLAKSLLKRDLSDKDYCTIIWGLSKFVPPDDSDAKEVFLELVDALTEERCKSLSNDDIVNLLRSISLVYLR